MYPKFLRAGPHCEPCLYTPAQLPDTLSLLSPKNIHSNNLIALSLIKRSKGVLTGAITKWGLWIRPFYICLKIVPSSLLRLCSYWGREWNLCNCLKHVAALGASVRHSSLLSSHLPQHSLPLCAEAFSYQINLEATPGKLYFPCWTFQRNVLCLT